MGQGVGADAAAEGKGRNPSIYLEGVPIPHPDLPPSQAQGGRLGLRPETDLVCLTVLVSSLPPKLHTRPNPCRSYPYFTLSAHGIVCRRSRTAIHAMRCCLWGALDCLDSKDPGASRYTLRPRKGHGGASWNEVPLTVHICGRTFALLLQPHPRRVQKMLFRQPATFRETGGIYPASKPNHICRPHAAFKTRAQCTRPPLKPDFPYPRSGRSRPGLASGSFYSPFLIRFLFRTAFRTESHTRPGGSHRTESRTRPRGSQCQDMRAER